METINQILARELGREQSHIDNVIKLLDEGNTIPFIARYRKELHGAMDDTTLRKLEDRLTYLRNLDQRRQEVKKAVDGQGKLTPELSAAIDAAATLAEVEDLYRPYKQKRRTRATVAREKGLEPLAQLLYAQERSCPRPEDAAADFVDPEKGVETVADALQGANDIVAELLSDDAAIRKTLRTLLMRQGHLRSLAVKEEDSVYRLYYDFDQPVAKLADHQILAINRGEKEGFLSVTVLLDRDTALPVLRRAAVSSVCEDDFTDPLERLATYYCLSRPVAELFYAQFGEEAFSLAASFYNKPRTTIRVNTLRTSDAALTALLQSEGHTVTPAPLPHALTVEFSGSPAASAAFQKGFFHVQGLASQFAALCVDAQPGQQVLDLCAAPGGKSLTLAEAMQNKGQLVSGEFVPARVPLLQKAFDRCGITCAVAVENDAALHNTDWPRFDRVLCDVPCSGLGVIAKKPDIRYKDLDGIENLLAAQQKILQNGADSLAENGRLVYSTCTVNAQENQAQVQKFLSANPDFRVVTPEITLSGVDVTPLGTLFLPHKTGTDGFFAAILERK